MAKGESKKSRLAMDDKPFEPTLPTQAPDGSTEHRATSGNDSNVARRTVPDEKTPAQIVKQFLSDYGQIVAGLLFITSAIVFILLLKDDVDQVAIDTKLSKKGIDNLNIQVGVVRERLATAEAVSTGLERRTDTVEVEIRSIKSDVQGIRETQAVLKDRSIRASPSDTNKSADN